MLSTFVRYVIRLALWLVAATIAAFVLLFLVVATARYERTEGSCPNASVDILRGKVLTYLESHGIQSSRISSDGQPIYHTRKLGVWEFPLLVDGDKYIVMINCNEQVTGDWKVKEPAHNTPSPVD
ncbi:hypothetical protein WS63_33760 [Burkholderia stagnalis]|nr:hypothetical protein WS63_33760 [Burkholderia stagnalis]